MRPQVLATTGAGDSSDEEEEEEEEAVATRDKKSRLTSVGDHPNDRYRSLKCLVCRYEASSAPDLQQVFIAFWIYSSTSNTFSSISASPITRIAVASATQSSVQVLISKRYVVS